MIGLAMPIYTSAVGSLAPIETVMLPEALAPVAKLQHLSGKRGARFPISFTFRFKKK